MDTTAAAAKRKAEDNLAAGYDVAAASAAAPPPQKKPRPSGEEEESKRQARLESNRKAARESRRRKKVLVEELQRSVIFFTRANAQLKQKNEGLEAMLFAARSQTEIGGGGGGNALGSTAPPQVMANATVLGTQEPVPFPVPSNEDAKPAAMSQPQAESALMASLPDNQAIANNPVSAPQATFQAQSQAPGMAQQSLAMQQLQQVQQAQQQAQQQAANNANNNGNALMANWLAMAQAAAMGGSGMVPNPMLQIPGLGMAGMLNPAALGMVTAAANGAPAGNHNAMAANPLLGMAAAGMGMANPFALNQLQQQHQQQAPMAAVGQQQQLQQQPYGTNVATNEPSSAPAPQPPAEGVSGPSTIV